GKAGVHAVPWTGQRLIWDQVGRGKAELAAALVAVGDLAAELKGGSEQAVGLGLLARQHEPADVAGGDDLAVDFQQRMHGRGEALVGLQQASIAQRLVTEAEVL